MTLSVGGDTRPMSRCVRGAMTVEPRRVGVGGGDKGESQRKLLEEKQLLLCLVVISPEYLSGPRQHFYPRLGRKQRPDPI